MFTLYYTPAGEFLQVLKTENIIKCTPAATHGDYVYLNRKDTGKFITAWEKLHNDIIGIESFIVDSLPGGDE